MNRFKNISLVYECDNSTLRRATMLAKENRARLTIVHPVKPLSAAWERVTIGRSPVDVRKLVEHEEKARLKRVVDAARSHGVRATSRLLFGEPFLEIIRDVIDHNRDLVIMTAEGKRGLKQRLFGSMSTHLMRKCPVPVLVMKPGRRKQFQHVLAAIDPEVTGSARDTLNRIIIELASSMSSRENAELHVVHVWTLFGETLLRRRGGLSSAEVNRWEREERDKRHQLVEDFLAKNSVTNYRLYLVKGNPADVIPLIAARQKVDLLVMGTVCRTGIPGFIIGNTAEEVLDSVACSVLTVKPQGFVSPVAPLIANKKG